MAIARHQGAVSMTADVLSQGNNAPWRKSRRKSRRK
nr:hypothetical protein [Streptomyces sp. SID8375]